jgi:hypothetical protein
LVHFRRPLPTDENRSRRSLPPKHLGPAALFHRNNGAGRIVPVLHSPQGVIPEGAAVPSCFFAEGKPQYRQRPPRPNDAPACAPPRRDVGRLLRLEGIGAFSAPEVSRRRGVAGQQAGCCFSNHERARVSFSERSPSRE